MKTILTLAVIIIFSFFNAFAQTVKIQGSTQLEMVEVKLISLTTDYLEEGNYKYVTSANGKFKFMSVPTGGKFLMSFSKKGYVTKLASFDFTNKNIKQPAQIQFAITMDLEADFEETSLFDEPICKWKVNDGNEIEYDVVHAGKMQKKAQALKKNNLVSPSKELSPNKPWDMMHSDSTREIGTMKDGKLHGPFQFIDKNGTLLAEGNYVDGRKDGAWIDYWSNGNVKQESFYERGREVGTWLFYHCNSILYGVFIMKNGEIDGGYNYSIIPTSKELTMYTEIVNGQEVKTEMKDKVYITYKNGNNFLIANYKNGQKTGVWKWFSNSGELVKERTYEDDKFSGEERYLPEEHLDMTSCDK